MWESIKKDPERSMARKPATEIEAHLQAVLPLMDKALLPPARKWFTLAKENEMSAVDRLREMDSAKETLCEKPEFDKRRRKEFPQHENKASIGQEVSAGRANAQTQIEWLRDRHLQTARQLDALLRALPVELPPAADQALYDLALEF